jgi:hypothetical protein
MSETNDVKTKTLNTFLKVIIIDDESDQIPTVLGITPEREKELEDIVRIVWKTEKTTITDNFVEISKQCKHANELTYCIYHLGAQVGKSTAAKEFMEGKIGSYLKNLSSEENSDETND